ncbi:hypothetical protein GTZ89_45200 [Streptomyces sp. SID8382]|uniref:hypothetical protein n=1 Tax=Streptomyces malaysiensis TaxID=92644 RepID=UPI00114CF00F|nr:MULTISPECIES: hypothetical protein [unclassified Streptomyces]MYX62604.1 hypothetical protein [Streptomyces sp. SID8382]
MAAGQPSVPQICDGESVFEGAEGEVTWLGVRLTDAVMGQLREGPWAERVGDLESSAAVIEELRALATTDMAVETLGALLASEVEAEPLPWEVGEALAEVLLEHWHSVVWVWNNARDRRTRKASLPGADLVGLSVIDGAATLLFGEVKSSSDTAAPPNVIYGRSGLIKQLERLADQNADHWTLIKWLRARCSTQEHRELYKAAASRYVQSQGRDIHLVGCLIRDTSPNERDVSVRGATLARTVVEPMRALLTVWYLPVTMASWPSHVGLENNA